MEHTRTSLRWWVVCCLAAILCLPLDCFQHPPLPSLHTADPRWPTSPHYHNHPNARTTRVLLTCVEKRSNNNNINGKPPHSLNTHSHTSQLAVPSIVPFKKVDLSRPVRAFTPLKVMMFIDGSWLFYTFRGRGGRPSLLYHESNPVVNWDKLPALIARELQAMILNRQGIEKVVEVDKTLCIAGMTEGTLPTSMRYKFFAQLQQVFDTTVMVNSRDEEKCVDIALASEILYYATVPDAYDVAVVLTGDKDFVPALQRVRQMGKKVAICSSRGACNQDLIDNASHTRDFDVIWLEDNFNRICVGGGPSLTLTKMDCMCIIYEFILSNGGVVNSRDIGRYLQSYNIGLADALTQLKKSFGSLRSFLDLWPETFSYYWLSPGTEFRVQLKNRNDLVLNEPSIKPIRSKRPSNEEPIVNTDELDEDGSTIISNTATGHLDTTVSIDGAGDVETEPEWAGERADPATLVIQPHGDDEEEEEDKLDLELDKVRGMLIEEFSVLTVADLKAQLKTAGLSQAGKKQQLVERLVQYEIDSAASDEDDEDDDDDDDDDDLADLKYGVILEDAPPLPPLPDGVRQITEEDLNMADFDDEDMELAMTLAEASGWHEDVDEALREKEDVEEEVTEEEMKLLAELLQDNNLQTENGEDQVSNGDDSGTNSGVGTPAFADGEL